MFKQYHDYSILFIDGWDWSGMSRVAFLTFHHNVILLLKKIGTIIKRQTPKGTNTPIKTVSFELSRPPDEDGGDEGASKKLKSGSTTKKKMLDEFWHWKCLFFPQIVDVLKLFRHKGRKKNFSKCKNFCALRN